MKYSEIKQNVQKLRRSTTKSEERLWLYLRRKQLNGKQFYRQHPIIYDSNGAELFYYVPDFYCSANKLAVELDGEIHLQTKKRDAIRDERLESKGIVVLRFKNEELLEMDKVLNRIREYLI